MQNNMLYAHRTPAQNFWLAWLPGSRVMQICALLFIMLAICNPAISLGLCLRLWQGVSLIAQTVHFVLSYMAATVPVLAPRIFVFATTHQSGNEHQFRFVTCGMESRLHAPVGDVTCVTQFSGFTDWVMAATTEASYLFSESLEKWTTSLYSESCLELSYKLKVVEGTMWLLESHSPATASWSDGAKWLAYYLQLWVEAVALNLRLLWSRC